MEDAILARNIAKEIREEMKDESKKREQCAAEAMNTLA